MKAPLKLLKDAWDNCVAYKYGNFPSKNPQSNDEIVFSRKFDALTWLFSGNSSRPITDRFSAAKEIHSARVYGVDRGYRDNGPESVINTAILKAQERAPISADHADGAEISFLDM